MSRTAQWARVLDAAAADLHSAETSCRFHTDRAREHLASMTPERRAMLEAEWHQSGAPVPDIRGRDAALMRARGVR